MDKEVSINIVKEVDIWGSKYPHYSVVLYNNKSQFLGYIVTKYRIDIKYTSYEPFLKDAINWIAKRK